MLTLGYNTNGFAHHQLEDALEILAEIGYQSVAITLDYHCLNPITVTPAELVAVRKRLEKLKLRCVVETGSRFLLDAKRKHWPTLLSEDVAARQRRFDFLIRSMEIAQHLGCEVVSFWSGAMDTDSCNKQECFGRLTEACHRLANIAEQKGLLIGFEPEPGMLIETMSQFDALQQAVNHPSFRLTLDVGHLHCLGEGDIASITHRYADKIVNVHIEDMKQGVHDHLMFGEGTMNFSPILRAFEAIEYPGCLNVELSRHSHNAVSIAKESFRFLTDTLSNR